MKLLVIGAGGREHALAWRLAQSPRVQKVYVAPGNAGTAREPGLSNLPITDIEALADFAQREQIQLTVVGPEAPLAAGVVNIFLARGLPIFGPTREAAQLESSKDFAVPDLLGRSPGPRLYRCPGCAHCRQGRRPGRRQGCGGSRFRGRGP
jgi:phosphoribosylamine---glycine ligase